MTGERDCGAIRIASTTDLLVAVCSKCKYRLTRNFHARKRVLHPELWPQGRPMGLLLAWLQFECDGDPALHRDLQTSLSYARRNECRVHYRSLGVLQDQFNCERPPWDSETGTDPEPKDPP